MVKALSELSAGERGSITLVEGEARLRRRLLDMGAVAGTEVRVERSAPLGDPIEVRIKGFHLTLRRSEAARVWVKLEG